MKKYFFWILVFPLVFFFTGCKETPKSLVINENSIDSLYALYPDSVPLVLFHGNQLLSRYDYDGALSDGAKAFRLDSFNLESRFLYGRALNSRAKRTASDILEAQRQFKYVVKREPKNKFAYVELASTYGQIGDMEKAFKIVNQALRIDKRFREAYVLKGSLYLKINNRKLAKSSYETAIQQDPKFYEGYIFLGSLYEEEKDSLCLEYFLTAVQLRPESVEAKYALAFAYQNFNRLELAKSNYREMIQQDSEFPQSYFQLGFIKQFKEIQLDSAVYFYKRALEKEPRFPEAWYNLGLCYKDQKNKTLALKSFASALKYNPDFYIAQEEADKLK